jgi:tetraacyldisaccharide 4'-kinase
LEIQMLDGERGLGNRWMLPSGPLREPEQRLRGAELVIIKKTAAGRFTWPDAISMELYLDAAVAMADGRRLPLEKFAGQPVHAVAAIGNPGQFFDSLTAAGLEVDSHALPDHARLAEADLTFVDRAPVFITEKDSVKCKGMTLSNHWYVPASACFTPADAAHILTLVQRRLAEAGVKSANRI